MFQRFLTSAALLVFIVAATSVASSAAPKTAVARYVPARGAILGPAGKMIPLTGFVTGMMARHVSRTQPTRRKGRGLPW
ncbi:MAG TPA: hypothetical protein VN860_00800, partial [Candidatus Acidoferrales bacterium]|nr:hypothetical protein [Candidatus Acidoferrales bacterium]